MTYRSLATTVKYVYPFMTPVSDLGEQKKRMERIRSEVGWRRVRMRDRGILRQRLVTRRRPPREMNRIDRIEPAARTASIMDDQPARASPSPSPSIFLSARSSLDVDAAPYSSVLAPYSGACSTSPSPRRRRHLCFSSRVSSSPSRRSVSRFRSVVSHDPHREHVRVLAHELLHALTRAPLISGWRRAPHR